MAEPGTTSPRRGKTKPAAREGFRLPPLMGHRGACGHAPENTLASIRRAAELGAGWVEFDVMLSGDGVPLLFHDDALKRVTGEAGLTAETPFARLAQLDAGAWFGPEFRGERVPSLRQALELILELGLHPNIEIKPTPGRDVETAIKALEAAREAWPADRPPPLVSSFSRMSLAAAMARAPDWPRAFITFKIPTDWQATLEALDAAAFHVHYKALTWELISLIKSSGRQVATFTVNDPRRALELYESGVDCIITDTPERIAPAFEKSQARPS